jgi:hypothetical protein
MIPCIFEDSAWHLIQSLDLHAKVVTTWCGLEVSSRGMDIEFMPGEPEDLIDCEDCIEALGGFGKAAQA